MVDGSLSWSCCGDLWRAGGDERWVVRVVPAMLFVGLKLRHGLAFALSSILRNCQTVLLDNCLKTATAIVERSWSCQAV